MILSALVTHTIKVCYDYFEVFKNNARVWNEIDKEAHSMVANPFYSRLHQGW